MGSANYISMYIEKRILLKNKKDKSILKDLCILKEKKDKRGFDPTVSGYKSLLQ